MRQRRQFTAGPWPFKNYEPEAGDTFWVHISDRARLVSLLAQHFSLDEIRSLCFDIGYDFDELGGERKTAKIRELLLALERRCPKVEAVYDAILNGQPLGMRPKPPFDILFPKQPTPTLSFCVVKFGEPYLALIAAVAEKRPAVQWEAVWEVETPDEQARMAGLPD